MEAGSSRRAMVIATLMAAFGRSARSQEKEAVEFSFASPLVPTTFLSIRLDGKASDIALKVEADGRVVQFTCKEMMDILLDVTNTGG